LQARNNAERCDIVFPRSLNEWKILLWCDDGRDHVTSAPRRDGIASRFVRHPKDCGRTTHDGRAVN